MSPTLEPDRLVVHLDRMYGAAWAMCGCPHEAEDLVQETCMRLLGKPRRVEQGDEVGYLLTALRNTYINRRRAAARRPRATELVDVAVDAGASTADQVRAREIMGWIRALPDDLRQATVAVDVVGLTQADAARNLGISERALAERLARARIGIGARLRPDLVGSR